MTRPIRGPAWLSRSRTTRSTWKWTRHLEKHSAGRYHYPAVIQGRDGRIHAIYSCFIAPDATPAKTAAGKATGPTLKGIKHAMFNEAWIRAGD